MKFRAALIIALATVTAHAAPLPQNTIDCSQFRKDGDAWVENGIAVFSIGSSLKNAIFSNQEITPHTYSSPDGNLYDILERKCGGAK
jgi:hypothetical protein